MMSKDSEALYEFAHWLSEKGREAREELVYKQYTSWIEKIAVAVVVMLFVIFIAFIGYICWAEATADTIILRDGGQS